MAGNHEWPAELFQQQPFEAPPHDSCIDGDMPWFFPATWTTMMGSRRHEEGEAQEQAMQKRSRVWNESCLSNQLQRIFFKTRPCKMFEEGRCPHGKHCTFAHGPGDIRQPPVNWQEIAAKEQLGDQQQQGSRARICKRFYSGERCLYGDNCTFLHVRSNEGRGRRDDSRVDSFGGDGDGSDRRLAFWKTRLCHKYEMHGHCPNGDKCQYAHGFAELKKHGGNADAGKTNPEVARSGPPAKQARDAPQAQTQATREQEARQEKKLPNWKWPKKISRIYGDWIDD